MLRSKSSKSHKLHKGWIVAALVLVAMLVAAALRIASVQLRAHVLEVLGPRASAGAIELGWNEVRLHDLHIRAASGPRAWPARDELRAAKVVVVPDLRSLWTAPLEGVWHLRSVHVERAYLSVLRTRDGKLRVLPALADRSPEGSGAGTRPELSGRSSRVVVGEVLIRDGSVEFHDASLPARGIHRVELAAIDAKAGPVHVPALDRRVRVDLNATLKGPRHDGKLHVEGQVAPATRDARFDVRAGGVDLVVLQPYLLRAGEGSVKAGRLDLTLDVNIDDSRLRAPGTLALTALEISSGSGVLGTFAGVPRQAVLAALRRDGRVDLTFVVEGRIDDPSFSLNESLAARVSIGLAEALGLSLSGVVEGIGSVVKGLFGR